MFGLKDDLQRKSKVQKECSWEIKFFFLRDQRVYFFGSTVNSFSFFFAWSYLCPEVHGVSVSWFMRPAWVAWRMEFEVRRVGSWVNLRLNRKPESEAMQKKKKWRDERERPMIKSPLPPYSFLPSLLFLLLFLSALPRFLALSWFIHSTGDQARDLPPIFKTSLPMSFFFSSFFVRPPLIIENFPFCKLTTPFSFFHGIHHSFSLKGIPSPFFVPLAFSVYSPFLYAASSFRA